VLFETSYFLSRAGVRAWLTKPLNSVPFPCGTLLKHATLCQDKSSLRKQLSDISLTLSEDIMSISSLKDLGYQQAGTGDSLDAQGEYALMHIAGFPEDIPSEAKEMLYDGYRLRQ
jgi:hypothetical protein